MVNKKIDIRNLKERRRISTSIKTEDREFMRQMEDRISPLSSRHNSNLSEDDDMHLGKWYLRKFRKK